MDIDFKLGNFKAFGKFRRLPIKPLTLLYGPNSSGKSSFIHSLALMHEAVNLNDFDISHTSTGQEQIDLGRFRNYIFKRDTNKHFEWGIELSSKNIGGRMGEIFNSSEKVSVNFSIGLDDADSRSSGSQRPKLLNYKIIVDGDVLLELERAEGQLAIANLKSDSNLFKQEFDKFLRLSSTQNAEIQQDLDVSQLSRDFFSHMSVSSDNVLPYGIAVDQSNQGYLFGEIFSSGKSNPQHVFEYFFNILLDNLLGGLRKFIAEQLSKVSCIGPLRSIPQRHMMMFDSGVNRGKGKVANAWESMILDQDLRNELNKWLGANWLETNFQLEVRQSLSVDRFCELMNKSTNGSIERDQASRDAYSQNKIEEVIDRRLKGHADDFWKELIFKDVRYNTHVSSCDIGVGINQVLPVLVSAFGSLDSVICIEQPELHIHPALQSELADVFIQSAKKKQGNTFILETHSEHLLLRILRRIRETGEGSVNEEFRIGPDDVSILYFEPCDEGVKIVEIPVTSDGEFSRLWPNGFFAERALELFGQ